MDVRPAETIEIEPLARIWFDGWRDAHEKILPPELARYRTLESFRERLQADIENVRVVGPKGQPLGFCTTKGDELYQLYVSAHARGSGVATALLCEAEQRLAAHAKTAWLACAIGNERAAKFYEKQGWRRVGSMTSVLPTPDGPFPLQVWRYEKVLYPRRGVTTERT